MFRNELKNYGKGIHCYAGTLYFRHGMQVGGGLNDPQRLTIGTRRQTFFEHNHEDIEALAVDKRFTSLFTDEEANEALMRLLDAGYRF